MSSFDVNYLLVCQKILFTTKRLQISDFILYDLKYIVILELCIYLRILSKRRATLLVLEINWILSKFAIPLWLTGTTVILAVAASSSSSFTGRGGTKNYLAGGFWEQPFAKPYFENSTKPDVSTTVGQTAYLHCRVRNLGDRAVSSILYIMYIF